MTGHDVKAWRMGAGMTQNSLAIDLGVSRRTVQGWECAPSARVPRWVAWYQLAKTKGLKLAAEPEPEIV